MGKEEEYKEMFYAEAFEHHEELDKLFTLLEKNPKDNIVIDNIFRVTHTLKGNAMGLGFVEIAELSHVMEDIFSEVKSENIELTNDLFDNLFKAGDKLGALVEALKTNKKVSYKGIRTKLEVYLKRAKGITEDDNQVGTEQTINKPSSGVQESEATNSESTQISEIEENKNSNNAVDIEESINLEEENNEESIDKTEKEEAANVKLSFSDQVQIPVKKLDNLLNLVGELIIEKDSLIAQSTENGTNGARFSRLHRITSDLQYGVMDVRLVQVGFMFNKFHRIIRDVASIENKKVNLKLEGTEIEIDRNILKIMSDSMVHMVRNAVSHGIESPKERIAKNKPEEGTVTLSATNEKDTVIIEVSDDGNGIDHNSILKKAIDKNIVSEAFARQMTKEDILMLIFEPGFSNAETVTEVSGRGVGMDVVKRATESIGGKIKVFTEVGKGSTIRLELPSSMAVKGALLFEMNHQEYAVPLSFTEAVISLRKANIHKTSNGLISNYLDKTISILFLADLFAHQLNGSNNQEHFFKSFNKLKSSNQKVDVLVVSYENKFIGLVVDKLLQQKEIVEKTLSKPLDQIMLFSGATILGNGNVCMVLDIATILRNLFREKLNS